jgi:hypothetical protein
MPRGNQFTPRCRLGGITTLRFRGGVSRGRRSPQSRYGAAAEPFWARQQQARVRQQVPAEIPEAWIEAKSTHRGNSRIFDPRSPLQLEGDARPTPRRSPSRRTSEGRRSPNERRHGPASRRATDARLGHREHRKTEASPRCFPRYPKRWAREDTRPTPRASRHRSRVPRPRDQSDLGVRKQGETHELGDGRAAG